MFLRHDKFNYTLYFKQIQTKYTRLSIFCLFINRILACFSLFPLIFLIIIHFSLFFYLPPPPATTDRHRPPPPENPPPKPPPEDIEEVETLVL